MAETRNIAVVGAGMAGITAARGLVAAGHSVQVFDKGRGLGGRLATRRGEGFALDHGAPALDAADPAFRNLLAACGAQADAQGRYVGQPGMSGIARHLSEGLPVTTSVEISAVTADGEDITLEDSAGSRHVGFDHAVLCIPAPQAARLLSHDPAATRALAAVRMAPVWTLLLVLEEPLAAPLPRSAAPFAQILREGAKPGRDPDPDRWVAHADATWTATHLELDKPEAARRLLAAFGSVAGARLPPARYCAAHRWRFARTEAPLGHPFLRAFGGRVAVGGDWALGVTAEDAWRSGLAIADALS